MRDQPHSTTPTHSTDEPRNIGLTFLNERTQIGNANQRGFPND